VRRQQTCLALHLLWVEGRELGWPGPAVVGQRDDRTGDVDTNGRKSRGTQPTLCVRAAPPCTRGCTQTPPTSPPLTATEASSVCACCRSPRTQPRARSLDHVCAGRVGHQRVVPVVARAAFGVQPLPGHAPLPLSHRPPVGALPACQKNTGAGVRGRVCVRSVWRTRRWGGSTRRSLQASAPARALARTHPPHPVAPPTAQACAPPQQPPAQRTCALACARPPPPPAAARAAGGRRSPRCQRPLPRRPQRPLHPPAQPVCGAMWGRHS